MSATGGMQKQNQNSLNSYEGLVAKSTFGKYNKFGWNTEVA